MRTDSPIKVKDDDSIGRYPFAEDLVEGLLNSFKTGQDCLIIGLNGSWGTGKSSLLNFINTEVEKQSENETYKSFILHFNPWLFSSQEQLQKAFLTKLGKKLKTINTELSRLGEDLIAFSYLIDSINQLNPDLATKSITKGLTFFSRHISKRLGKLPTLEELKAKIDETLEKSSFKLFIFIDDLDRLHPDELVEMLKLVKLNAGFKNTHYILAYDRSIVIQSIKAALSINGESYMDKIIQVDYTIPEIPPQKIKDSLFKGICEISSLYKTEDITKEVFEKLWEIGFQSYYKTLRSVHRFLNAVELRIPSTKKDVNFDDFIIIEAIRLFDHKGYVWIYNNKLDFISTRYYRFPQFVNREEELLFNIPNYKETIDYININKEKGDLVKYLNSNYSDLGIKEQTVNLIFRLLNIKNFSGIEYETIENLRVDKRLIHKDYFDIYFTFEMPKHEITAVRINKFIEATDDFTYRKNECDSLRKENKFSYFLSILSKQCKKDPSKLENILFFLIQYFDKELNKEEAFQWFSYLSNLMLDSVIFIMNEVNEELEKTLRLIVSKSDEDSISTLILLFYISARLKRKELEMGFSNQSIKNLRSTNEINEMIEKGNSYIYKQLTSEQTDKLNLPFIKKLLQFLYFNDERSYTKVVKQYKKDSEKTLILLVCSLKQISSVNDNDDDCFLLQEKSFLPQISLSDYEEFTKELTHNSYDGRHQDYINLLLKFKAEKFDQHSSFSLNDVNQK